MSGFNVDAILPLPDSKEACDRIIAYFQAVADRIEDERTCYEQFHKIVCRIFGFEGAKCWLEEAQYDEALYNSVMRLLKPDGPLFRLMFNIYMRNADYEFQYPLNKLPFYTLSKIESGDIGTISQLYYVKLEAATNIGKMDVISLDMFEYFTCCFAFFVLDTKRKLNIQSEAQQQSSSSYSNRIMKTFSPTKEVIFGRHSSGSATKAPVRVLLELYLHFFFPISAELQPAKSLPPSRSEEPTTISQPSITIYNYLRSFDKSDLFLLLLSDFWLSCYRETIHTIDSMSPSLQPHIQEITHQFSPSFLQNATRVLYCSKIVVRHILKHDSIRLSMKQMETGRDRPFNLILQRSNIAPHTPLKVLQPTLYRFLRATFHAWITTTDKRDYPAIPMHRILSLWEAYITPWVEWRQHQAMSDKNAWIPYVMSNWCFYTNLVSDFLRLIAYYEVIDLTISANNLNDLKGIAQFLTSFDGIYYEILQRYTDQIDKSVERQAKNINAEGFAYSNIALNHIIHMEGTLSNYQPLISKANQDTAMNIMEQCQAIYAFVSKNKTPLPSPKIQAHEENDFLTNLAEKIGWTEDQSTKKEQTEKSINQYQLIEKCVRDIYVSLGKIFNIGDVTKLEESLKDHAIQQQQRRPLIPAQASHVIMKFEPRKGFLASLLGPKEYLHRIPPYYNPESDPDTLKLTFTGRSQVVNGQRKTDKFDVPFLGNPMYRMPYGDFEIESLVRLMIHLSEIINEWIDTKFYGKLKSIRHVRKNRNTIEYAISLLESTLERLNNYKQVGQPRWLWNFFDFTYIIVQRMVNKIFSLYLSLPSQWRQKAEHLLIELLVTTHLFEHQKEVINPFVDGLDDEIHEIQIEKIRCNLRPLADWRNLLWLFIIFLLLWLFFKLTWRVLIG
jgi:hypothetical protein